MQRVKAVTIYDVAKKAGVSPATVSRVLNDPSKVAKEKKDRVLDAVKALNFVPKAEAVAKARKSYRKIGIIAPFFTQPSFMERLRGVAKVLGEKHYELVLYSIYTQSDLENYISTLVTANRVDGLIFFCVHLERNMLDLLSGALFPVVFVEDNVDGFDSIEVRNVEGGQQAAQFFYALGCRRPGFVGERSTLRYSVPSTEERFRGYQFYFANQGILMDSGHCWIGEFEESSVEDGIRSILSQEVLPDCVFCSSDVVATLFLRIAKESGISVPADMKVLGFDDIDMAAYAGLSSISQNLDESGRLAAELIMNRIKDPKRDIVNLSVPLRIKKRETTA